jgi:hypothetical protein
MKIAVIKKKLKSNAFNYFIEINSQIKYLYL